MKILFFESTLSMDGHTYFYDYNAIMGLEGSKINPFIFAISIEEQPLKEFRGICDNVYYLEKINDRENAVLRKERKLKYLVDKIQNTLIIDSELVNFFRYNFNYFKYKKVKIDRLNLLLQKAIQNGINNIHIFDIDGYGDYLNFVFNNHDKVLTGTLHWYPNTKKKERALKKLIETGLLKKLIVHGDYIRNQVIDLVGEKFSDIIHVIEYPTKSIDDIEVTNELVNLSKYKKPFLLSFGSLRYDKGIDLLLDALKNVKEDYTLIIAGKENNFDKLFLEEKIEKNGLTEKVYLDIDFISNNKMIKYFEDTDIVVVPYRKIFKGQSGPLTEGVNHNKIILASNTGQIGYTVIKNKLGETFECENVKDMTIKLVKVIKEYKEIKEDIYLYQQQYKERVSIANFKRNYYNFFTDF